MYFLEYSYWYVGRCIIQNKIEINLCALNQ